MKLIIECYSLQWSEAPFINIDKLDSNPSMVSKSYAKCGMKLLIHSQTSMVAPL